MAEQIESSGEAFKVEPLGWRRGLLEIITGIAITLGLALLWILERARNAIFDLLDRVGLKPRPRRASAFPPGRPRKLRH